MGCCTKVNIYGFKLYRNLFKNLQRDILLYGAHQNMGEAFCTLIYFWSSYFLFRNLPSYPKIIIGKEACTPAFTAALFISWDTEALNTHRRVHRDDAVPLRRRKNAITLFASTCMDLEMIMLSEVTQKEKYKYHTISLTLWNLKYSTNEHIYETGTDSQT